MTPYVYIYLFLLKIQRSRCKNEFAAAPLFVFDYIFVRTSSTWARSGITRRAPFFVVTR